MVSNLFKTTQIIPTSNRTRFRSLFLLLSLLFSPNFHFKPLFSILINFWWYHFFFFLKLSQNFFNAISHPVNEWGVEEKTEAKDVLLIRRKKVGIVRIPWDVCNDVWSAPIRDKKCYWSLLDAFLRPSHGFPFSRTFFTFLNLPLFFAISTRFLCTWSTFNLFPEITFYFSFHEGK